MLDPPANATFATIDLEYQPNSWEYLKFIYLANTRTNAFLADEGVSLLAAWLNTGMATRHTMATATWGYARPRAEVRRHHAKNRVARTPSRNLRDSPVTGDNSLVMNTARLNRLFERYRNHGNGDALGAAFDATAPALLRVACHLAPRGADPEDLVQQTWLTALERAASFDPARPLMPWLIGILTHHVRNARRRAREFPVAPGATDAADDPFDLVAQDEVRRAVLAAVRELPARHRAVLELHFRERQSSGAIAARLDSSPGAVRMQIHRALDALRRMLPRTLLGSGAVLLGTHRGLAAVRTLVLKHATREAAQAASMTTVGLLLGAIMAKKVLLVVAAVVLVITGTWLAMRERDERRSATVEAVAPALDPIPVASETIAPGPTAPERASVSPATAASEPPLATRALTIIGRVVADESGLPIAGARVELVDTQRRATLSDVRSDAAGGFRLPGQHDLGYWNVIATATGYAPGQTRLEPGTVQPSADDPWMLATDDIRLERGARAEGVFVHTSGAPIAGARLLLARTVDYTNDLFHPAFARDVGRSGPDGRFALEHIEPGGDRRHTLFAATADAIGAIDLQIVKRRDVIRDLVIMAAPTGSITIEVQDESGHPMPDALVTAEPQFGPFGDASVMGDGQGRWNPRPPDRQFATGPHPEIQRLFSARTDESGLAVLAHLPVPSQPHDRDRAYNILVRADGYELGCKDWQPLEAGERVSVALTLKPLADHLIRGRVRDASGAGIAGVHVTATDRTHRRGLSETLATVTDAHGEYRIAMRCWYGSFRVDAFADRWTALHQDVSFGDDGTTAEIDFVVTPTAPIAGRVVDERGRGVPFAIVGVSRPESHEPLAGWRTDPEGYVTIKDATAGEQVIEARLPWPENQWLDAYPKWTLSGGARDVVLAVARRPVESRTLTLELVDAVTREPVEPAYAELSFITDDPAERAPHGRVELQLGHVVATAMKPGPWRVKLTLARGGQYVREVTVAADVPDSRATLELEQPARLRGRVVFTGGLRPERVEVHASRICWAVDAQGKRLEHATGFAPVEAMGRFFLGELSPGPITISMSGAGCLGETTVEARAGEETEVTIEAVWGGRLLTRGFPDLPQGHGAVLVSEAGGPWRLLGAGEQRGPGHAQIELGGSVRPGLVRWRVHFHGGGVAAEHPESDPVIAEGTLEIAPGADARVDIPPRR